MEKNNYIFGPWWKGFKVAMIKMTDNWDIHTSKLIIEKVKNVGWEIGSVYWLLIE